MNKIFNIVAFVFVFAFVGTLQSCLKDNTEVFSENSSTRMTEYLDNAKSTILSGNATWLMEIYPQASQSYGGWAFTMRFTNDSVYCRSELAGSETEIASLWRTTRDDGPSISFDTYNALIHYFSTPSATAYQSFQGEFEWVITDVQQDLITLQGKKTGNTIYMRRMTEDPKNYVAEVGSSSDALTITGLQGSIGGKDVDITVDTDTRQIVFTSDSTSVSTAYCATPEGIRFYKPVQVNGTTLTSMTTNFNSTGGTIGMTTNNGEELTAVYPEGYRTFADFIGDYTLYYNLSTTGYKKIDVSLVAADKGFKFYLTGLNPNYNLTVNYKKSTGTIEICSQAVLDATTNQPYTSAGGYYIGCIAWDATTGYVSFANTIGVAGKWNTSNQKNIEIDFSDNGIWQAGYKVNSFMFYYFNGTEFSDATRVKRVDSADDYIQGTVKSCQLQYIKTMIKK